MKRWMRVLALCALIFGLLAIVLRPTAAQQQSNRQPFWNAGPGANAPGGPRIRFSKDGYLHSAGAPEGAPFSSGLTRAGAPDDVARAFIQRQTAWFFDGSAKVQFDTERV